MNNVVLAGRLTRDPETRYSTGENATAISRFSIAVQREFKNVDGNYDADFINCVAFGKTGEFVDKYFKKGNMIILNGRIQTGSYTNKDGVKVYTTDVVVNKVEFAGGKNESSTGTTTNTTAVKSADSFVSVPDNVDDFGLPFN